ncbi:class I SAM-dependent methyltransferase [Flavobacteriaceae bacterium TP-CH-4]|uniref:Class I SAM-dependent methyltransferase n=1 Tax=Pelagihabitans pacificus TaxID=2696054 RepID=A0A967E4Q6_9FLAO|nr:class I SAM-dependent methyltransferase [Pelagihabitans pacificus]NHF58637.1 class I SAM-dependent methyltransferase [Pelagihabitans pacificus]
MNKLHKNIERHYLKAGLFEDILQRLKEQQIALDQVKRSHISGVDEFHVRGAEVSKELANSIDLHGLHVLDVGCGLGGPCRMLADEYQCTVTGIDLSQEYVRTAAKLSKLVGLDHKTTFIRADATELPFENARFEVVWTQHAQMNIPDKNAFYSEIKRVLKKGGYFLFYEILKKGDGAVAYPMPWASDAGHSFLFTAAQMEGFLKALGFTKKETNDQTRAGIDFFEALIERLKTSGPPPLGLNVLMGGTTEQKITNLLTHLKKGDLELISGTYQK